MIFFNAVKKKRFENDSFLFVENPTTLICSPAFCLKYAIANGLNAGSARCGREVTNGEPE